MVAKRSKWSCDVHDALYRKGITQALLGEKIGVAPVTISAVINGRYSSKNSNLIVNKINAELGISGEPDRTGFVSDEWADAVFNTLRRQKKSITSLAKDLDLSRDNISMVLHQRSRNRAIIDKVSEYLVINVPAFNSSTEDILS